MLSDRVCYWIHLVAIALFWVALALVIWGQLAPGAPQAGPSDKIVHFAAYFLLAALAAIAATSRSQIAVAVVGLVVLGGGLELLQRYVDRDASLWDWVADLGGVLVGVVIARLFVGPLFDRRFT